jgi:hypothetical protein
MVNKMLLPEEHYWVVNNGVFRVLYDLLNDKRPRNCSCSTPYTAMAKRVISLSFPQSNT